MTPAEFIAHWQNNPLTERAGAQQHFDDLCDLLGVDKPRDPDNYCFERGAQKDTGGGGWADVWKRDCFGWENKKPHRDLHKALAQLREYAGNLGNPPLLIVCDRERIEIHTAFRGYPDEPRTILLQNIGDPANLQLLRWVFTDPDKLRPLKSNAAITAEAAAQFAKLAKALRAPSHTDPQQVAHFLTQCIFCMFAEDEGLLHDSHTDNPHIFTHLLKSSRQSPEKARDRIGKLFNAMQNPGGEYGNDDIAWFNGGLFSVVDIPALSEADVHTLYEAAAFIDWRAIDPTIFGTLFERGLDPNCRAQLGAHYTDVATINKLIEPLITRPLAAEWAAAKNQISALLSKAGKSQKGQKYKDAINCYYAYLERLRNFRVLDAACGSGNFLYLALHALKNLEHQAQIDAEAFGFPKQLDISVGTDNILGLEINEYAAELARITVWIGDIQWCQRNGRPINKNPILSQLSGIQHRDALLNADGSETEWPQADVIVGNPPFLGGSKKRGELGDAYFDQLNRIYQTRVPGGADLVCYWFDKARIQIEQGKANAAGLVSTNSIRGGANRKILEAILDTPLLYALQGAVGEGTGERVNQKIFEAWPDEDWFDAGTAVRVSLVCFGRTLPPTPLPQHPEGYKGEGLKAQFAGEAMAVIHADLTAGDGETVMDLTKAKPIKTNLATCFMGASKKAPFDIEGELARSWLAKPNPNNLPTHGVVRPLCNALDVTRRNGDRWIIDFGASMAEADASLYELPFEYVVEHVKPIALKNSDKQVARHWWRHARPRIDMRNALSNLK